MAIIISAARMGRRQPTPEFNSLVAFFYFTDSQYFAPKSFSTALIGLLISRRLDFHAVEDDNNHGGFGMGFAPVIAFTFLVFLIGPIRLAPQIIQVRDSVKIPISRTIIFWLFANELHVLKFGGVGKLIPEGYKSDTLPLWVFHIGPNH